MAHSWSRPINLAVHMLQHIPVRGPDIEKDILRIRMFSSFASRHTTCAVRTQNQGAAGISLWAQTLNAPPQHALLTLAPLAHTQVPHPIQHALGAGVKRRGEKRGGTFGFDVCRYLSPLAI